jgi:hypothetical protein
LIPPVFILQDRSEGAKFMWLKSVIWFIWSRWDPVYYALSNLKRIEQQGSGLNVFRVRLVRYKGKNVKLSDGTCICKNDLLLRIHLHNVLLLSEMRHEKNDIIRGRLLYRFIRNSLPGLAHYMQQHPNLKEIKAVIGVTLLNRGSSTLGFETVPISNRLYKLYKWLCMLPIYFLFTERPFRMLKRHTPACLFMTKQKLLGRYHHSLL